MIKRYIVRGPNRFTVGTTATDALLRMAREDLDPAKCDMTVVLGEFQIRNMDGSIMVDKEDQLARQYSGDVMPQLFGDALEDALGYCVKIAEMCGDRRTAEMLTEALDRVESIIHQQKGGTVYTMVDDEAHIG